MSTARETQSADESTHELLDAVKKGCTVAIPTKSPTPLARFASLGIVIIFLILLSIQITSTKRAVQRAYELDKTYITFSQLDIDKDEYFPGDLIGFKYTRYANIEGTYPIIYLSVDTFENLDTGEIFSGIFASRQVSESGAIKRHGLRLLPLYATPGRYRIEGSVSSQTNRLTAAQPYASEVFVVKSRPSNAPIPAITIVPPVPIPSPTP